MFCAKYDYKMDIAVKQEEAFEDGMEQRAVENAVTLVKEFNIAPEDAAVKMGAPLNKVLKSLSGADSEESSLYDKYGYNLDIAVKQEEAFEDGMNAGMEKGKQKKAIDTAISLLKMNLGSKEQIAEATGLTVEKINELSKDPSVFP